MEDATVRPWVKTLADRWHSATTFRPVLNEQAELVNCGYCTIPGPDIANAMGKPSLTMHAWQYGIHERLGVASSGCPRPGGPRPMPGVDYDAEDAILRVH